MQDISNGVREIVVAAHQSGKGWRLFPNYFQSVNDSTLKTPSQMLKLTPRWVHTELNTNEKKPKQTPLCTKDMAAQFTLFIVEVFIVEPDKHHLSV